MQKARSLLLKIVGGVLFLGCSIQIVLGLAWMLCNLGTFQWFPDSRLYVEISESFICDEYEGILYPLLVMLARGVGKVIPIPYFTFLYLLQLAMAFITAYAWMGCLTVKWERPDRHDTNSKRERPGRGDTNRKDTDKQWTKSKWLRIWGSLVIITYPLALQCHMAVLPESLVSSLLLLECYFVTGSLRRGAGIRPTEYAKVLGCFLALSLMLPEYVWIGGIPLGIMSLVGLWKDFRQDKGKVGKNLLLLMAFLGILYGMNSLTVVSGSHGRVSRSLESTLVRRCATGWISQDIAFWPDDVNNNISQTELLAADLYPDHMEPKFEKLLEDRIGVERARKCFREIVRVTWERYSNFTIKAMAKDGYAYLLSPVALQTQLQGSPLLPDSYSPRNYEIMRNHTPVLTMWYVNYHAWWFVAGLVMAGVVLLGKAVSFCFTTVKQKDGKKGSRTQKISGMPATIILFLLTIGTMIATYVLQGAGVMDYKKTIAIGCIWTFGMVAGCLACLPAEQDQEEVREQLKQERVREQAERQEE